MTEATPVERPARGGWFNLTNIAVVIILLLAALLRLAFIYELAQYPFMLVPHGWQPDYSAFDNSALALADSGRRALGLPPVERTYPRMRYYITSARKSDNLLDAPAREYKLHPDLLYGRPPLYVYFLGALYFVLGDNQIAIRLVQTALGLCNALLAYALARRLCGRAAAFFTLATCAFYWPLIIFENVHYDKPVVICCLLLMVYCALRWRLKDTVVNAAALGAVFGVSIYGAPALILFAPVLPLWMGWVVYQGQHAGMMWRKILRGVSVAALAFGLTLTPLVLRNYYATGSPHLMLGFHSTLWRSAVTFISGEEINELCYLIGPFWDDNPRHQAFEAQLDTSLTTDFEQEIGQMTMRSIRSNLGALIRYSLSCALLFWSPRENHSLDHEYRFEYAMRLLSPTLARLPGNFTVVFIPFVFGLGCFCYVFVRGLFPGARAGARDSGSGPSASQTAALLFLVLLIAAWYPPYVVYGPRALYRIPLIPLMSIIGAWGVARAAAFIRERNWLELVCGAAPAAVLLPVMLMVPISYESDVFHWYRLNSTRFDEHDDSETALAVARRIADAHPEYAEMQNEAAIRLRAEGNDGEALRYYMRALNALPESRRELSDHIANQVSRLLLDLDEDETLDATPLYHHALDPDRHEHHTMLALARSFLRRDAPEQAMLFLEAARETGPENAAFHHALGLALDAQGRTDHAIAALAQGIERFPDDPALHLALAHIHARQGNAAEACRSYRIVLELDPDNDEAHRCIVELCGPQAA